MSKSKVSITLAPTQHSFRRTAISLAVSTAIVATHGAAFSQELEEIVVTANRREESLQDVAFSIQAFGGEKLERLGMQGLDNYARLVPTLSYYSASPGESKIIFRGVADSAGSFIAQSSSSVYLDEQPLTQNAHVDVRMVDIERLEALSGPQGSLYGDSSQSGTLRIITNKANPTKYEATATAMLRTGSESAASHEFTGTVNLPVIKDKLAIRLVGFNSLDGGFVDNVLGVTPRFGQKNNAISVEKDWNEYEVSGGRASARWFINTDWTATGTLVYQDSKSDGPNEHDPTVGDLQVVRFFNETRDDEWLQYGLTLEGKIGGLNFLSATSYFDRDVSYIDDRTTYASYFSQFCNGPYDPAIQVQYAPAYCFGGPTTDTNDPLNYSINIQQNKRFTQEFRVSGGNSRWDWLAGVFYEDKSEEWDYRTVVGPDYMNTPSFAYWSGLYDVPADTEAWWNSHDRTEWTQYAIFGETNIHFNDKWTMTAGGRFYDTEFDKFYFVERPDGRLDAGSNPDGNPPGTSRPTGNDDGFLPKVSFKYNVDDDRMVYGLYSEGFRAGGTNRGRGNPARVVVPFTYAADTVKNLELGSKLTLAGGRVQLNATLFRMTWEDAQFEFNDPSFNFSPSEPFQTVVANAFDAVNQGIDLSLTALLGQHFELNVNAAVLSAETDSDSDVCSTADTQALIDECTATFVPIPKGSRLPLTPEFKGSIGLQYNFMVSGREAYVRGDVSHTGDSLNQLQVSTLNDGPAPQFLNPSFTTADVSAGLKDQNWNATIFINNLTDKRANLFANPFYYDYFWGRSRETVNRPREFGIRFSYHWE